MDIEHIRRLTTSVANKPDTDRNLNKESNQPVMRCAPERESSLLLPMELMCMILTKLPVTSLLQWGTVSKAFLKETDVVPHDGRDFLASANRTRNKCMRLEMSPDLPLIESLIDKAMQLLPEDRVVGLCLVAEILICARNLRHDSEVAIYQSICNDANRASEDSVHIIIGKLAANLSRFPQFNEKELKEILSKEAWHIAPEIGLQVDSILGKMKAKKDVSCNALLLSTYGATNLQRCDPALGRLLFKFDLEHRHAELGWLRVPLSRKTASEKKCHEDIPERLNSIMDMKRSRSDKVQLLLSRNRHGEPWIWGALPSNIHAITTYFNAVKHLDLFPEEMAKVLSCSDDDGRKFFTKLLFDCDEITSTTKALLTRWYIDQVASIGILSDMHRVNLICAAAKICERGPWSSAKIIKTLFDNRETGILVDYMESVLDSELPEAAKKEILSLDNGMDSPNKCGKIYREVIMKSTLSDAVPQSLLQNLTTVDDSVCAVI